MGFGIPSLIHVPHPSCKSFIGAPLVSACLLVSPRLSGGLAAPFAKRAKRRKLYAACPGG